MKTIVTILLSLGLFAISPTVDARTRKHHRAHAARDEISLSPKLIRRLQSNLIDGGYLDRRADGRLGPSTRHALVEFQREYHLRPTGRIDRGTAEALLGHDEITAFVIAHR